jgi:hypothetical protein
VTVERDEHPEKQYPQSSSTDEGTQSVESEEQSLNVFGPIRGENCVERREIVLVVLVWTEQEQHAENCVPPGKFSNLPPTDLKMPNHRCPHKIEIERSTPVKI